MESGMSSGTSEARGARQMIECPFCHKMNVVGADTCVSCDQDIEDVAPRQKDKYQKSLLSDPVSNLEYHEPIHVNQNLSVGEGIRMMNQGKHGSILVSDGDKFVGIFTERDVIYKVLGKDRDISTTLLKDVMTKDVEGLMPSDPVAGALHKMAFIGCRHLPVFEGPAGASRGRCLGIISIRALVSYFADKIQG